MISNLRVLAIVAVSLGSVPLTAQEPEGDLAKQGYALLKRYCYRCHGIEFRAGELNVLDRRMLTAAGKMTYLVAGDSAASLLWQRAGIAKDMPPEDERDRPAPAELETLRRWIEAQAPFPTFPSRPFLSEVDLLTRIRDDLLKHEEGDRPFLRYFTLVNLHNLGEQFDQPDLRLVRAALSKVINSLSWQDSIVVPTVVDADQTILCIDVRKLGWDRSEIWQRVLGDYPYALKHDGDTDPALSEIAAEVYRLANCDLPYVRADWFIAHGSRPPIYYQILELPETLDKLTELLEVDLAGDFQNNRLLRAGVAQSGVSTQNRVIDWHAAKYGSFWITADFKPEEQKPAGQSKRNIFQKPLGPVRADHPFPELAFEPDGGEMIFHLPNGLQGYFLTDAKGNRINGGPIDVVSDPLKASGTFEVKNGISCMACHDQGMRRFVDRLASGMGVFGEARRKAEQLLAPAGKLERLLDADRQRFLTAQQQACGPFLRAAEEANGTWPSTEPVMFAARHFQKDLGLAEVAGELGFANTDELKALILGGPGLRSLGMLPILNGGTIKRDQWQASGKVLSRFQVVANTLGRGTPLRVSFGEQAEPSKPATASSAGE